MNTSRLGMAVAIGLILAAPAWSATQEDHTAHHQQGAGTTAPTPMGNSMMGGRSGMTQGGGMMGNNMMGMMASMMPMMNGMMSSHVDGRLAFFKSELKITDKQAGAWDKFADAYRTAASSMQAMRGSMMGMMQGDLPARLALHQQMMTAHLDAMKTISGPLNALYDALTPEQRKTADDLIGMGM